MIEHAAFTVLDFHGFDLDDGALCPLLLRIGARRLTRLCLIGNRRVTDDSLLLLLYAAARADWVDDEHPRDRVWMGGTALSADARRRLHVQLPDDDERCRLERTPSVRELLGWTRREARLLLLSRVAFVLCPELVAEVTGY
eukprot:gene5911-61402_t